jgi:hypothetical protein
MENEYRERCWACHDSGVILSEGSSLDAPATNHEHPCPYCPEGLKVLNNNKIFLTGFITHCGLCGERVDGFEGFRKHSKSCREMPQ